ncbi:MAG: hypothetical protein AB1714_11765 [Acidobacteriota bacterium]
MNRSCIGGTTTISAVLVMLAAAASCGAASSFTVAAKGLTISGGTKPGDSQKLSLKIETKGSGVRDVMWVIYADNLALVKSDTKTGVTAGTALEVFASWTALAGQHTFHAEVDPNSLLEVTAIERSDNRTPVTAKAFADWSGWAQSAMEGSSSAVNLWKGAAVLVDVRIDGAMAWGGRVAGTFPESLVSESMMRAGTPADVSRGFALALREGWEQWQASVRVPGLAWYPAFAAFPGASAPPTPNLPTPLASLTQSAGDLSAGMIAARIKSRIGAAKDWPEGSQRIDTFSAWFASKFTTMLVAGTVTNVIGSGVVPSYAPPQVVLGPVKGVGVMRPGGFQFSW